MVDNTYWVRGSMPLPGQRKNRESVVSPGEDISTEVVNPSIDSEPELLRPGMWRFRTNLQHCCIYRVPNRLREVNPEAYTPQLLLIGPLHHALKDQALMSNIRDKDYTKFMGYLNMEQHKKSYLKAFQKRVKDENVINGLKRVIKEKEEMIRQSYSESTTWIQSQDFVEMILHDSVFILEFIWRVFYIGKSSKKTGDVVMDEPTIRNTVLDDLVLLENQLPYFILEKLFDPIVPKLFLDQTFQNLIIRFFSFEGKIKDDTKFKHFTDLFRCFHVDSLVVKGEVNSPREYEPIEHMYNVEKLEDAGVKFEVVKNEKEKLPLSVKFEKGCLKLPFIHVNDSVEMRFRNLMALEQCHYPYEAYVCNFIIFLDHLIDTHKDVDHLVAKGIIKKGMGYNGYVAQMVNKLSLGIVDCGSIYYKIAADTRDFYENPINKARAILKRVYFSDPWTGTATVAAVFLLLMTLGQTVISVMQVLQK